MIFEGIVATQWEVGVKILKHLCVPVTKVQAHLLSTFSIELIAIVLTVNRCVRCLVDCGLQQKQHNLVTMAHSRRPSLSLLDSSHPFHTESDFDADVASTSKQATKPPAYVKLYDILCNGWLYEKTDGRWNPLKRYHEIPPAELAKIKGGGKFYVCLPILERKHEYDEHAIERGEVEELQENYHRLGCRCDPNGAQDINCAL